MEAPIQKEPLTERFLAQHRLIQRGVHLFARHAAELRRSGELDAGLARQFLHFFRRYLLAHQAEEERVLFPWLVSHGLSREPLERLVVEHRLSERRIEELAGEIARVEQHPDTGLGPLCQLSEGFAEMLSLHDWKEDHILYPMADMLDREQELHVEVQEGETSCLEHPSEFLRWIEDVEALAVDWPSAAVRLHLDGPGETDRTEKPS